jgi:hypothetical protein
MRDWVDIVYLEQYSSPYYGNEGFINNQTLIFKRGFDENLAEFPSAMDFKQLGMNIKVDDSKFCLLDNHLLIIIILIIIV